MANERYDVVIIGSGAGGGTMAHALSRTSARILLVERGEEVRREDENWNPEAVWIERRYQARERWLDGEGREFSPYTHYCVGGNTKFWGSVLYRLRREDFQETEHADGVSPGWPIVYADLEPYYDQAEELYHVRGDHRFDPTEPPRRPFPHPAVPHSGRMSEIVGQLSVEGLHPGPLPLGLRGPGQADGCVLCDTCNSYPCKIDAKSDADVCCIQRIASPTVTLWTNTEALRLETDPSGRRVAAVVVRRQGEIIRVEAPLFVVSCGAINSAALLLRSANDKHRNGLANSSGLVGRRYMAHLTTMMSAWHVKKNLQGTQRFQKTVAVNDFYLAGRAPYPLGHIQSQGRIHPAMIRGGAPPRYRHRVRVAHRLRLLERWTSRSVEWLAMTEDLPCPENRVVVDRGRIRLHYRPHNQRAHEGLLRETTAVLRRIGFKYVFPISFATTNTTHQCGTLCFGTDPRRSVLDAFCRSHDVDNLFVVDASFFPSSAAVNPGLTIVAQALRVAEHIQATDLT
ncbi:MAG TPA: GMC family oxidoreductase [Vicinamibacterales bacterium]|nr:GMC family oxidoreductase [Vicinamibacterales bacterium]